ncbi:MAG: hypothetical protein RR512_07435 [Coprobacillus sp.]
MDIFNSVYISSIGIVYLLMLSIPNIIWSKHQPTWYNFSYENKVLVLLERIGQVLVTAFSVFIINKADSLSIIWLIFSIICMFLYECYWVRYFKSEKGLNDFYDSFLGVPVPGASLPVIAFILLGIYHLNIVLIISTIIFGIGHIGIHLQHSNEK